MFDYIFPVDAESHLYQLCLLSYLANIYFLIPQLVTDLKQNLLSQPVLHKMASHSNTTIPSNQTKRISFSNYTGGNASLLLEKAKAGIRRSTPDSEALASSDEEQDQHHHLHSVGTQHGPRPTRRASWLNDFQQGPQRRTSMSGSTTFSPASSHPTTPVADQNTWTSSTAPTIRPTSGRVHSSSNSFPWGSTIWNSDTQKGPPSRLTEVLPSPTTIVPPNSASFHGEDPLLSPRMVRDTAADSAIPFAIPLHPTPKTYRSQSYSVGQLDPEAVGAFPSNLGYPTPNVRNRAGSSYAGLQHRPSRPGMLGDFSHDPSVLGQLREVDDDDESSTGSEAGVQLSDTQARTIEQLAMENAFLRQAAANQLQVARSIDPTPQTHSTAGQFGTRLGSRTPQHVDFRMTEERDHARDEMNEPSISQPFDQYNIAGRRFSEHNANTGSQFSFTGTPENRKLESVKKGQWQSSLGFGGIAELPQSRRHSFADVPTRHGSISSAGEPQNVFGSLRDGIVVSEDSRGLKGYGDGLARPSQGDSGEYAHFRSRHSLEEQALELEHLRNRNFAASYFSNTDPSLRNPELYRPSNSPPFNQQAYPMQAQYNRQQHLSQPQSHPAQLLSMVTFKACRAEVYYVQEGTGLQVKAGDLVIVEADRGTDLGTVAHHNISWSMAKELKDHYIEEHFKWLMMFSRHGQNGNTATINPNVSASSVNTAQTSAIGGMGSPGQIATQDQQSIELKPKMIKRLAQAHEIQTLRDKEGNEAKAKRVCQQKVVEHRLNMEILDAEFQM